MHMSDALISPVVGGTMLAISSGLVGYSIKKIKYEVDSKKIPLMGVMGAFVFASQMINFSIPGTGSSGHLGGGLLLAILLGPYAGFITMASILLIQALIFADGGLLAYGCNVFNLGFYTCFIAYPLIYKNIINKNYSRKNIFIATMLSAIIALQLGALSVVIQTVLSGKTELHFNTFVMLMQPIHLAIGIVEGIVTAAIVNFVITVEPDLLKEEYSDKKNYLNKRIFTMLIIATVLIGGILSLYASEYPDGLEWSILKTTGQEEIQTDSKVHDYFGKIQEKVSILPDYSFKNSNDNNIKIGTSFSGVFGSLITVVFIAGIGCIVKILKKRNAIQDSK